MEWNSPETWRWIWLATAVAFAVGEIAVAGSFFLAPFAIAAAFASGTSFAGASAGWSWLVFVGVGIVASAVLRPLARRLDATSPPTAAGAHRWVGREAVVLDDIPEQPGGSGRVLLDREEWRAQSADGTPIPAGRRVVVTGVAGTRLVVREH